MSIIDKIEEGTLVSPHSGKIYTNLSKMPELTAMFAIFMSETGYSGKIEDNKISATILIAPIKKYLYTMLNKDLDSTIDVSYLFASARGTNLHNGYEQMIEWWGDNSIKSEETLAREINGYWVTGTYDFQHHNQIKDLKHVSNFAYKLMLEDKEKLQYVESIEEGLEKYPNYFKYSIQLSIYRWLCNDESLDLTGSILFNLNNGGGFENHPINSEVIFPLFTSEELEEFIVRRIDVIKEHLINKTFPDCTPTERGSKPPQYALKRYSQATGKYRTVAGSKFEDERSFKDFVIAKGRAGDQEEVTPATHILCNYCKFQDLCVQNNT